MQVVFGMLKSLLTLRLHELPLYIKMAITNWKYSNKNLITELGCDIKGVEFGDNVYLAQNVTLKNSSIDNYSYINKNSIVIHTKVGKFLLNWPKCSNCIR